jgi:hypothetical protein
MPDASHTARYPWYEVVSGSGLQQGDILADCPLFKPPLKTLLGQGEQAVGVTPQNAIVMSQSCDLEVRPDGSCNIDQVIFCPLYAHSELKEDPTYGKPDGWENARKGRHPSYHVLNKCELSGQELDFQLVDLGRVFSLHVELVRELASMQSPRVRLNPPYREHLSQAFARFFMRVGLPVDIPSFMARSTHRSTGGGQTSRG